MISLAAFPLCARRLGYQNVNLSDETFTEYWAAVNVAFDLPDTQLTDFGGFNFNDRSDKNGKKLLKRLEEFLNNRAQRYAANNFYASEGLKASLGARGVKTSMLKSEEDYWTAAETMFPGCIKRNGGLTSLYAQIHAIPKKKRQALGTENLRKLPVEWLSKASGRAKHDPSTHLSSTNLYKASTGILA
ncbi:hypothetical protein EVC14_047 [Rhizobium phage RHph_I3_18]|nr:hypothetical protein EVC14_047 [Rhizobium phage RHph_I3_18]